MEGHLKPQRCADATIKGKSRNKILMMMLVQKAKKTQERRHAIATALELVGWL